MLGRRKPKVQRNAIELPEKQLDKAYSWIDIPRDYVLEAMSRNTREEEKDGFKNLLRLTDDFEKVETPEGFNITLLPHQKVIIKAMHDLEQKRYVRLLD